MGVAENDANSRNTLSALNETTGLIEPLRVDPIFGALEIYGVVTDNNTPTTYNRAGIDGNGRNTLSAWNDTTGSIEALRCSIDGILLCKIVS